MDRYPLIRRLDNGWLRIEEDPEGAPAIAVKVEEVEGQPRIVGLRIEGQGPITGEMLRRLRPGWLEQFLTVSSSEITDQMGLTDSVQVELRGELFVKQPEFFTGSLSSGRPPLTKPDKSPYPDDFYEDVAAVYRWAVANGLQPAPYIAETAGVPPTTAARWVKEARRRKKLGRGRKGRVGEVTSVPVSMVVSIPTPTIVIGGKE